MSVDSVTTAAPPPSLQTAGAVPTAPKQQLDKEVFLALLVAQLRNQDPSSPMDTTEMMAQSTQLASMEQLTGLTDVSRESFALQMRIAASGMVGRQVSYVDDDGATVTGVASEVSFLGEVPTVTVDGVEVALDAVSAVRQTAPAPAPVTSPTTSTTPTPNGTAGSADAAPAA